MLDEKDLFDSDNDPELEHLLAKEKEIDFNTHSEERGILTERKQNIEPEKPCIVIPSKPQEFKLDLCPLKERVHFEKNKASRKRYKNMGSNDKIVESILCKICDNVVESAQECKKCKKMFCTA